MAWNPIKQPLGRKMLLKFFPCLSSGLLVFLPARGKQMTQNTGWQTETVMEFVSPKRNEVATSVQLNNKTNLGSRNT